MSVTTPETFILTGGAVDSEGSLTASSNGRVCASLADMGYTGTLTAASGGTAAYVTISLPTSTWDGRQLRELVNFARTINCRLRYTKAS